MRMQSTRSIASARPVQISAAAQSNVFFYRQHDSCADVKRLGNNHTTSEKYQQVRSACRVVDQVRRRCRHRSINDAWPVSLLQPSVGCVEAGAKAHKEYIKVPHDACTETETSTTSGVWTNAMP